MNKKLFLPLLLLLTLQIPNSIIAMGEGATDFEWSDKQADSQKFRNDSVQEKFNDMVLNDRNRTIDAKREKLRQAISKGDVEATKRWSSAFKPEETHHVKLALSFAKTKVELDEMNKGKQNKRTESQVENQIKIKNHLESLFAKEKAAAKKTESVPATPRNESVDSNQQAPATPPATPRAENVDSARYQDKTPTKSDQSVSDVVKKRLGLDDESQAKKKQDALKKKQDSFISAAQKGDVKELTKLLTEKESNIDINAKDSSGETALMIAAKKGDIATLKALLALKGPDGKTPLVDFNAKDSNGDTALTLAAKQGDTQMLQALLTEKGPDSNPLVNVNAKNSSGDTALMIATKQGDVATLQALLSIKGSDGQTPLVDFNVQDSNGDTALMISLRDGNDNLSSQFFSLKGIDVNVQNEAGETALSIATENGNLNMINRIITKQNFEIQELEKVIKDKKSTTQDKLSSTKKLTPLRRNIQDQYKKAITKAIESTNPDIEIIDRFRDIFKDNIDFLDPKQKATLAKIEDQAKLNNQLKSDLELLQQANKEGRTITESLAADIKKLDAEGATTSDPKLQAELLKFKNTELRRQNSLNALLRRKLNTIDRNTTTEELKEIKKLLDDGASIDPQELASLKSKAPKIFGK